MGISSAELDVLGISRDERATSDYDDKDGYSLMMNSRLYDGYTCSVVIS